ncbi:cupin domain-containing protein [Cupriavidus sp. UYPR2.512]|uniref:cupin domain-containing protein n=1 Tax=Cupriavidus sp. UYPR2.512 TaxID=1080187 RepID=UPI0003768CA1|nr:cupin domain-containing protein [Cupriavidus sp. UYPR2.512]UIF90292.1 cupin domain-containing protein [Cupriavidus necator]
MKPEPFVVTPDTFARPLNVVGERITVLASNAATQGYEVFLQQGEEGSGPPPHSHDWDESFYVTKGTVEIGYGDQAITAIAGTFVHVPAGTVHYFRFGFGGGEMISVTSHGGNASRLFTRLDEEIPPGAPDMEKLLAVTQECGVTISG